MYYILKRIRTCICFWPPVLLEPAEEKDDTTADPLKLEEAIIKVKIINGTIFFFG